MNNDSVRGRGAYLQSQSAIMDQAMGNHEIWGLRSIFDVGLDCDYGNPSCKLSFLTKFSAKAAY